MKKFNVIALANTFAVIDIVLHLLFRLWIWISPGSYENIIHLFVAGLNVEVTAFDFNISNLIFSTVLEAIGFWVLGAAVALIYNKFSNK